MSQSINSKIKYEYYPIKYLRFFFPIAGVLAFLGFLFYIIFQNKPSTGVNSYTIILAPFALMVIFVGLGFLLNIQEKKLLKCSDILNHTTPLKKWLNSTNIINFKGSVYVMTDSETQNPGEGEFVVVEVSKNKRLPKAPIHLDYYFNVNYDSKLLIFDDGKNVFSGFKLEKNQAKQQLEKSIKLTPILAAVGGLIPLIITIFLFFQINNLTKLIDYYSSTLKWNTLQAEIVKSNIIETQIKKGKSTVTGYKNIVEYKYYVDNNEFFSNVISFDYSPYYSYEDADKLRNYLAYRKNINIFYNPSNPEQAYIIQPNIKAVINKKTTLIYVTIIAFILGIFLVVFLVFFIQRIKSKQLNLQKSV